MPDRAARELVTLSSWTSHAILVASALALVLVMSWIDGMWADFAALPAAKPAAALFLMLSVSCVAATTLCSLAFERFERLSRLASEVRSGASSLPLRGTFEASLGRGLRQALWLVLAAAAVCSVALASLAPALLQFSQGRGAALFLVCATAGALGVAVVLAMDLLRQRARLAKDLHLQQPIPGA